MSGPLERMGGLAPTPGAGRGVSPVRLVKRLVVLAFAVAQAILVARILLDLGVIPAGSEAAGPIITISDALASPIQAVGLGGLLGGGVPAGEGFNPVMVAALLGWTVVEGLVMRVVTRFASV